MEDPLNTEPRQLLLDALIARDAERVAVVREVYRDWYELNDDDSADRQEWPDYFESAAYSVVLTVHDKEVFRRTIGWTRESGDRRIADIARVFERTGWSHDLNLWRYIPQHADFHRATAALDADYFARVVDECGKWAEREFAPWPDILMDGLETVLHCTLAEDEEEWESVMRWALPSNDPRLTYLTLAARAFEPKPNGF